jgi:hypothetical protein
MVFVRAGDAVAPIVTPKAMTLWMPMAARRSAVTAKENRSWLVRRRVARVRESFSS